MLKLEVTEKNFAEIVPLLERNVDAKIKLIDTYKPKEIIRDPTLCAYAFLKDKRNRKLRLRGFQDVILNDRSRFVLCAAANQIGKTTAAVVKALHHGLHGNNSCVVIGAITEEQGIRLLDEVKQMMKRSSIDFDSVIDD